MVFRDKARDGTTRLTGGIPVTFDTIYPIGSIHISTSPTNPAELFGGTWEAFATGRTLVGVNGADTDFDTVEETGGSKTHAHDLDNETTGARVRFASGTNAIMAKTRTLSSKEMDLRVDGSSNAATTTVSTQGVEIEGTSDASSSLQPYITVYMWKRTA